MSTPVPKNVAAVIGLVPTVIAGARRLPAKAVQLPVLAMGTALSSIEAAKREYDELADRGEKLIARLRGTSFDALEDTFEDKLSGSPVAALYEKAEDALDRILGGSTDNAKQAVESDSARAGERAEANSAVEQSVQEPLPVADSVSQNTAGGVTRVDSAATPEVVEQVEKIASNVAAPPITDHDELPLPDYDHMTLGTLRGRLRSLDMQQLVQLRDYEKSKADRLPVITLLDNRIAKLANGESTPTGAPAESIDPTAAIETKPPKKVGATAAAKNNPSPPHTKVRLT
jgi:hypothetical protein